MGKWGKCDFNEVKKLQGQIEAIEKGKEKFCRECAKELAARLLAKAAKRTPVGQYPAGSGMQGGTLRRNWTVGEVTGNGSTYEVTVSNPTEYAPYVEYGHRTASHRGWVPGKFMLTVSEQEIQGISPAFLEKRLQEYLRRCLDGK